MLQCSAREGLKATVEFLLSEGVSADVIHSKSASLLKPLEEAACAGHCDVVRLLLDKGADINGNVASRHERLRKKQMESNSWEDRHYWENICPLYAALRAGQGEVANLLIEGGANVSRLNSGTFKALSDLAAKYGLFDVLKLLDKLDVIEDFRFKNGDTIFDFDPSAFSVEDVRILLNAGGDIRSRDNQGNTPLHVAAAEVRYDIAELLIKESNSVNARNVQGRTCLHMASCSGAQDIVQLLVVHGAEVNVEDERGCTPLHNALSFHHYWLVEPLLKHGGNQNAVDYKGSTPLHAGCSYNDAYDFLYPDPADTEPSWYSAFQDEWVSIMISHGR